MRNATKIVLLSALSVAVVCSTASAQTTLRYKFKDGETLQYVMEQKMKMTMNIMNMDIDTKMNMSMEMAWKIDKANSDGSAKVLIKVTRAKLSMEALTGNVDVDSTQKNEPDDAIGKVFYQMIKAAGAMEMTGTVLATGEMKDIKVSEESLKAMKNVPGADMASPDSFKSMASNLVFPSEAVAKGKTWTNKNETTSAIGKMVTESTYTYDGPAQKDGVMLEKISIKPDLKIEPGPKSPIKEIKEVKGSGQIFFDNKSGRIVEAVTNQTMQMQLTANGINFLQTIDQTTTFRLKK